MTSPGTKSSYPRPLIVETLFCRFKREHTHQEWNPTARNDQSSACAASWTTNRPVLRGENHDIIFSSLMIFVSTTVGNQRSYQHAILQSFSTQAKYNQELTPSTKLVTLYAASAPMLSRGQKGDPHRKPPFLSSHSAGIVSPDQRVAAVLQHRLHPTRSRGRWCFRCYCCCCCHGCCILLVRRCCNGPPAETRCRDQRGRWTPPSRRRFHQRTQLLTLAL